MSFLRERLASICKLNQQCLALNLQVRNSLFGVSDVLHFLDCILLATNLMLQFETPDDRLSGSSMMFHRGNLLSVLGPPVALAP